MAHQVRFVPLCIFEGSPLILMFWRSLSMMTLGNTALTSKKRMDTYFLLGGPMRHI
jgi:hypothetical protein